MKPLTTFRIANNNLCGKFGRTAAIVSVVAIMAFVLFGGAVLSRSLDNGMKSLEARFGADIAVVPPGNESDFENVILSGVPSDFYLDKSIAQEISAIPGVEQVTTQFYLATLADAACCTMRVQIIGIDYNTDFVVMPWISRLHADGLIAGETIVGSDVIVGGSNLMLFFNTMIYVTARLERTATGMDGTVFVSMDTAHEMARTAQERGAISVGLDIDSAVSAILISVAPGYNISETAAVIRETIPNVGIVTSYGIYASMAANLRFFTGVISIITAVLGVLVILVLAFFFSIIANSRKKEFAVLRIMGATRKKLAGIVLTEALNISVIGAVLGSLFAAVLVFPFGRYIGVQMGMPLLLPSTGEVAFLLLLSLALSVLAGSLSSAYSAYKISRAEIYSTMREGE